LAVLGGCDGGPAPGDCSSFQGWGMDAEYHLIDLATGLSHGGFRSLEAAASTPARQPWRPGTFFAEMCVLNATIRG
jgi:hypothetical protein